MANILDAVFSETGLAISGIIEIFCTASLLLFMHFSAKYRNYKLSLGWYIAGFLFPLITVFVFLSKRKKFPGPKMKVCPICGDKYPEVYQVCGRCLIELPENQQEEKKKAPAKETSISPQERETIRALKREGWTINEIASRFKRTPTEIDLLLSLPE